MIQKGFIINVSTYTIERDCTYDDKRIDAIFYKVDGKDLMPIAYIFPEHNRDKVSRILAQLKSAKKTYDDFVADCFYKQFPTLRS